MSNFALCASHFALCTLLCFSVGKPPQPNPVTGTSASTPESPPSVRSSVRPSHLSSRNAPTRGRLRAPLLFIAYLLEPSAILRTPETGGGIAGTSSGRHTRYLGSDRIGSPCPFFLSLQSWCSTIEYNQYNQINTIQSNHHALRSCNRHRAPNTPSTPSTPTSMHVRYQTHP